MLDIFPSFLRFLFKLYFCNVFYLKNVRGQIFVSVSRWSIPRGWLILGVVSTMLILTISIAAATGLFNHF